MKKGKEIKLWKFAAVYSIINLILFHFPFFRFVNNNLNCPQLGTIYFNICLVILLILLNYFACYLICYLLRNTGKYITGISFLISSICIYFINTYNIIIDGSMIGNVLNTKFSEASGFFSFKLFAAGFAALIPVICLHWIKLKWGSLKQFGLSVSIPLVISLLVILSNINNFLWIGKYDTQLGGLLMPWSYTVNTVRVLNEKYEARKPEILLADASLKNYKKEIVVLVIGESARKANFSLYGYSRNTNPLLQKREDVVCFNANSCATYTTAGVKSILEYQKSSKLYEILPNYLYRTGVDVEWRSANWGEPPVHIKDYKTEKYLKSIASEEDIDYDSKLLTGLKERIESSTSPKTLIILHSSTSHGPAYTKKYPKEFKVFTPVCDNVEEASNHLDWLINAYDNTIVYTDYLLNKIITILEEVSADNKYLLYVSDHGESLGENNLFMHGVPIKMAPKEQYEIPFILWSSNNIEVDTSKTIDQHYVFHSILHLLSIDSPVYNKEFDFVVKK